MFYQILINAISVGSIYALIAMGYNMVYGILGQLNFAHGDVYTVGCFLAYSLTMAGLNPIVALLGGVICAVIINLCVERFAYRPLRGRAGRIAPTISAVGVAYIMRNVVQLIWGPQTYGFNLGLFSKGSIEIGSVYLGTLQIWILAIAIAIMVIVSVALKKTKYGQAIVSISQNITTSALMGINVNRVIAVVYAVGAALGVIGGVLFCSYYNFIYMGIGFSYGTMKAWMATIWGGIGSLKGAVCGALILGICETFASAYISTAYKDMIVWAIFIAFIFIRPKGLFPAQISEKV